ncbi:uncharacterized protein M421DRAFT_274612 [Didymella exigua CBS 183.55]|uniref:Transcription factor domain-containing protein n=1 Tax=Didymella exigua CBS 183.55 TaxID=1150837 RepID=A0A6A5RAQ1_9PLEO|nr:uncharacterized protein M421DRAFT_274612 [Didymella exigua CBS 183.55]KAF1924702.1 hypothetical protein M421DRAFT_274612 [Didymella exigua CBS 183.55]
MSPYQDHPNRSTAKFFKRVVPPCSLESQPRNLDFKWLDHSDPDRATIVRMKARAWVNKSKEEAEKSKLESQRKAKLRDFKHTQRMGMIARRDSGYIPTKITELRSFDAFSILPGVRKDRYHLLQYFLSSPFMWDALPCCDDKHILENDKTLSVSTRENSIMWNMARGEVSFVVWLYSVVLIRDGMKGDFNSAEVQSWYIESLRKIRQDLADQTQLGRFSDYLINALACIQATSSFAGMFEAAVMHHNAMTKILKIRGNGDILMGLKQLSPWSMRAIQWCEFFVSAEQVQLPDIPYYAVNEPNMSPPSLVAETFALTQRSMESLPFFRGPLRTILYQLHQLGLVYARAPSSADVDRFVAGPLYDTEYALLKVLASQKQARRDSSDVEILLAEILQLYLWIGPRKMRPQGRLTSLLASRVALTLSLFMPSSDVQDDAESVGPSTIFSLLDLKSYSFHCHSRPYTVNNLVAWSLALATSAGAAVPIPEYQWLKRYYAMHIMTLGLHDDIDGYRSLVSNFPTVDGFDWIDLTGLFYEVRSY